MKAATSVSTRLLRSHIDVEADAITAFARMKALAALLESGGLSDFEHDHADLFAVAEMFGAEVQRAKDLFYEMQAICRGSDTVKVAGDANV